MELICKNCDYNYRKLFGRGNFLYYIEDRVIGGLDKGDKFVCNFFYF